MAIRNTENKLKFFTLDINSQSFPKIESFQATPKHPQTEQVSRAPSNKGNSKDRYVFQHFWISFYFLKIALCSAINYKLV